MEKGINFIKRWGIFLILALAIMLVLPQMSTATSQWSRKYKVNCTLCHTSFPRLNHYGEQFMRNGYQLPGTQDGDKVNIALEENNVIPRLGDIFGLRLNFTPFEIQENALIKNGEPVTKFSMGKPIWIQLFTAGSIFKNVSIFIETEIKTEEKKAYSSWFRLGFHNLGGTSLLNLRVGNMDPLEWTGAAGRLRVIGPVKHHVLSKIKSSNGKGEDSVPLAKALPGISLYGYKGAILYEVGINNGAHLTDPNRYKNYWFTLRLENKKGSAVSFHVTRGTDTADTSSGQIKNNFIRFNPAVNLRRGDLDFIATYVYGKDENWNLSATEPKENVFNGVSLALAYMHKSKLYCVLQYDLVNCEDYKAIEYNALTPSVWYHLRDNMKLGFTAQLDLRDTDSTYHPYRKNSYFATIRTMF